MFCPKCGNILKPKKEKDEVVFICSEHGSVQVEEKRIREKSETKKKAVVFGKEEPQLHPKTEMECPKCGHREAYYWMEQTRSADEAPTRFYKCVKCGHSWREYS